MTAQRKATVRQCACGSMCLRPHGMDARCKLNAKPEKVWADRIAIEIPEMSVADLRRFWSHVDVGNPTECWLWTAGKSGFGHGRFAIEGKLYSPHRISYTIAHGRIPLSPAYHGTVVRHTCDNPACCNPDHLELGSQRDNARDMVTRDRQPWSTRKWGRSA